MLTSTRTLAQQRCCSSGITLHTQKLSSHCYKSVAEEEVERNIITMKGFFVALVIVLFAYHASSHTTEDVYKAVDAIYRRMMEVQSKVKGMDATIDGISDSVDDNRNMLNKLDGRISLSLIHI